MAEIHKFSFCIVTMSLNIRVGNYQEDATTLSIMTFTILTISTMALSIIIFSTTTLSIMTFSIRIN